MLDNSYTEKVQFWLNSEHTSAESIRQGALLLLQSNKNKVLYANIMRNPLREIWRHRLEYELNNILKVRLDGLTRLQVQEMDQRVTKEAEAVISRGEPTKGRRADHDSLPVGIQNCFNSCSDIYKKIRKLHTMLRSMGNATSCDRYEHLKVLDELDTVYRKRMQQYDEYKVGSLKEQQEKAVQEQERQQNATEEEKKKALNNERSYLKRLKQRLPKAFDSRNESDIAMLEYEDMLREAQQHINTILSMGAAIGEKVRQPLRNCGLTFPDEKEDTL